MKTMMTTKKIEKIGLLGLCTVSFLCARMLVLNNSESCPMLVTMGIKERLVVKKDCFKVFQQ